MAPNSLESSPFEGTTFIGRMMSLPALNDTVSLLSGVYQETQNRYQYVGAAMRVAETGLRVVATNALPLAKPVVTPLVDRVGGWDALDEWACRGLDRVEEAAPIITKPTGEIASSARHRVLGALAGDDVAQPSVSAAISTRATNTIDVIAQSRGGRVALGVAERMLLTAHALVDAYLPPREGDLHDTDGRDGTVGWKAAALLRKTRLRLRRVLHSVAHPHHAGADRCPSDSTEGSPWVAYGREIASGWYSEVTRVPAEGEDASALMRFARMSYRLTRNAADRLNPLFQYTAERAEAMRKSFSQGSLGETVNCLVTSGSYYVGEMKSFGQAMLIYMSLAPSLAEEATRRTRVWAEGCLKSAVGEKLKSTSGASVS